ncbi:putative RNA-binding protein isoform 1 [Schistosoma japonicum]|uniref:Probable RNA-binding protein EIF1AD n=2 Tax=Schistosoma japonicum TaxID=6182 RepID=Q5DBL0_SCHJA|nr:unknown [Schistosoma japonicum]TNN15743.1 putative RNA-binding protein isoform 1 [Schistosoma japonicum]TNN15744.1 putative RNA-binding protein isoform 1 [Schistosoma japonicum]
MILPSSVSKRKKAEKELFKNTCIIESDEIICKLTKSCGNYLFTAVTEQEEEVFVSIPERFRNAFYFSRGDFVICSPLDNKKVKGEIRAVLQKDDIKILISKSRWPKNFTVNIPKESSVDVNYISEDMLPSFSDTSDSEESECISDTK